MTKEKLIAENNRLGREIEILKNKSMFHELEEKSIRADLMKALKINESYNNANISSWNEIFTRVGFVMSFMYRDEERKVINTLKQELSEKQEEIMILKNK